MGAVVGPLRAIRNRFAVLSIRAKLGVLLGLPMLVGLVILALLASWIEQRYSESATLRTNQAVARTFCQELLVKQLLNDQHSLVDMVERLREFPAIVRFHAYDAGNGLLFSYTHRDWTPQVPLDPGPPRSEFDGKLCTLVTEPEFAGGERLRAHMEIQADQVSFRRETVRNLAAIVTGTFIVLFLAMIYLVQRHVARPVQALARDVQRLSAEKGQERRLSCPNQQPEIRVLSSAIDGLLDAQERVETALRDATERAEAANASKSSFLANVSHEIRTPMSAILGFTELLSDSPHLMPAELEMLGTIQRNGDHLLEVLNDVLDLSKIESGKMDVELVTTSPRQVLEDVVKLMAMRAKAKGIDLRLEATMGLEDHVTTDPTRLRQIVLNLVGNALKFTERGGVFVRAQLLDEGDSRRLTIAVRDTGIGMTGEQLARLFQAYNQADTSTTRRFGGTGMGLHISQRLAHMLGGDITVESETGRGSTFRLSLTVQRAEPGGLESKQLHTRAANAILALPSARVLVVDDMEANRRLVKVILEGAGLDVDEAPDGLLGLEIAIAALHSGKPFDVILSDLHMPVMDGWEMVQRLRERGYDKTVIALSANTMSEEVPRCLACGFDDYQLKPFRRAELLAKLHSHLVSRNAGEGARAVRDGAVPIAAGSPGFPTSRRVDPAPPA